MRITLRPSLAPDRVLDVTAALTATVAHALWEHTGGNDVLNWLEAERFVHGLAGRRSAEARPRPTKRDRRPRPKSHGSGRADSARVKK